MPLIPLFLGSGAPSERNLALATTDEDDIVSCVLSVVVTTALAITDEDDTVSATMTVEALTQVQPGGGVPYAGFLDYYRHRQQEEERLNREQDARDAELKRAQEALEEEAARIAQEEAAENRKARARARYLQGEIDRLKAESERALAAINRLREEEAARQAEILQLQLQEKDEILALMALGML